MKITYEIFDRVRARVALRGTALRLLPVLRWRDGSGNEHEQVYDSFSECMRDMLTEGLIEESDLRE